MSDDTAAVDVVCVPDAAWDDSLWTNRQQMMSRLAAREDVRVLYVSPPRFAIARWLRGERLRQRAGQSSRRDGLFTRRVGERLWVLQPLLPMPNGVLRRWAPAVLDGWLVRLTRRTARRLGFSRPVIWSYTPLATAFLGRLDERLLCYDVVDDYPSQPNYRSMGAEARVRDERLTRSADVVLTTSAILQRERSRLNPNCHLLGNAADLELFSRAREPGPAPAEIRDLKGPVLGFHGAVSSYKLDLELLRALAERRPDWELVLVGPATDAAAATALGGLGNLRQLGFRAPDQLPSFLRRFDVCVIPYRRTPYTERLSALKVREALAAGRPVVATDLPGFRELQELISLADGVDSFEAATERALRSAPPPLDLGHPALAGHSWDAKAERAWRHVDRALRASGGSGELARA